MFDNLDEALEPRFTTPRPSETVVLHDGILRVTHVHKGVSSVIEGQGAVELLWRPLPRVGFRVESASRETAMLIGGDVAIDVPGARITGRGFSLGSSMGSEEPTITSGFLNDIDDPSSDAVRVQFHLINFVDYHGRYVRRTTRDVISAARAVLVGHGWRVTIDAVPGLGDLNGLAQLLRADGSYAITHVGQLQRETGLPFTHAEARTVLADVGYFLSFASARWAFPNLLTAFDATGAEIWQDWTLSKLSRWRAAHVWWNEESLSLEAAFPGFLGRRAQTRWRSNLDVLVGWYVEASTGGGTVETGIVLGQAALELFSSVLLIEELGTFTATRFDNLRAAEKFRELLNALRVPLTIPTELTSLAAEASRLARSDGPHAFTAMRNAIIHAHRIHEVLAAEPRARYDAKMLGLWYLELAVLWLCGYTGEYRSRFSDPRSGSTAATVPW